MREKKERNRNLIIIGKNQTNWKKIGGDVKNKYYYWSNVIQKLQINRKRLSFENKVKIHFICLTLCSFESIRVFASLTNSLSKHAAIAILLRLTISLRLSGLIQSDGKSNGKKPNDSNLSQKWQNNKRKLLLLLLQPLCNCACRSNIVYVPIFHSLCSDRGEYAIVHILPMKNQIF